jgi:hypothetical protein
LGQVKNVNGGGVIVNERHLFRGKRDDGEWVTGDLVLGKYPVFKGWKEPFILNDEGVWEVDPATIGQCTGLRDSKRTDECPNGDNPELVKEGNE